MKPSAHRLLIGIFASLLAAAVFSALPAFAATITVTSLADSGPGSLRDSIASASSGDTINFGVTGTITLTSGELLISKNLTISGPGASSLAISGNNSSRVFNIAGGTVALSGLTIQNGNAGSGGGIYNAGTLTLSNITVSGNSASGDGGGGIYNCRTLTVTNSTLSGNSATSGYGGGIENFCLGTLIVTNSTLARNFANGEGGGIVSINGTVTLANSTISGNSITGGNGGAGIANFGNSTLSVTNSTISGNSMPYGIGGGIYNYGITTLTNSTISGNSASYGGGGIYNGGGTFTLKNAIVANDPSGGNCFADNGTAFSSQGYNLSDDSTCSSSFNQTGDLNSTPAGLDPSGLKANGGPTQTIALLARSAAVDAIPVSPTNYCTDVNGAPVTTDQRGVTRPQGPACDIGAFELVTDDDSAFSQLNGGNTFTGNQTVNGNMNATNFMGNGSGLTGVITGVTAGAGLTGGGTSGNVSLGLASAACGAGSAITAHPFTCTAFPTFGANTFTGNQSMPNLAVSGTINSGAIGSTANGNAISGTSNGGGVGVFGFSSVGFGGFGVYGQSIDGTGVVGNSSNNIGVNGTSVSSYGVYAFSNNSVGIFGSTQSTKAGIAAAVFNNNANGNAGTILLGQSAGVTKFSVDAKGDVAASGSIAIGGGTPIIEHLSQTSTLSVGSIVPGACTASNLAFTGANDGDTLALGVANSLMLGTPGILNYSAWVSAANTITIRVCNININGSPGKSASVSVSGTIRVDIWKH